MTQSSCFFLSSSTLDMITMFNFCQAREFEVVVFLHCISLVPQEHLFMYLLALRLILFQATY